MFRYHKETPGKISLSRRLGNIRGFFHNLKLVIIVVLEPNGAFGKQGVHSIITGTLQEHTRIIYQVGLRNQDFITVGMLKQRRQVSHDIVRAVTFRLQTGINRLIRSGESMRFTHISPIIGRKIDVEFLINDFQPLFSVGNKTVGHPIVKHTELYSIISCHIHAQVIVMITHQRIFQRNLPSPSLIHSTFLRILQYGIRSQHFFGECHAQRAIV